MLVTGPQFFVYNICYAFLQHMKQEEEEEERERERDALSLIGHLTASPTKRLFTSLLYRRGFSHRNSSHDTQVLSHICRYDPKKQTSHLDVGFEIYKIQLCEYD